MKYIVKLNQKIYEVEIEKAGAGASAVAPNTQPATAASQSSTPYNHQATALSSGIGNASNAGNTSNTNNTGSNNITGNSNTEIESPMPGKILSISATVGQQVSAGQCLMVLEAMKMENEMVAPRDGTVKQILVSQGTMVNTGDILAVLI